MKLADGESLLLKTYRRAAAAVGGGDDAWGGELLTVTNRDYYFMSKDEFVSAALGEQRPGVFMLEPAGRNTAPAVAMAAHHVAEKYGRDALMLVLAADPQCRTRRVSWPLSRAQPNWRSRAGW